MTLYFDNIDARKAIEIARNFLQQHYSVFDIKSTFENGVWLVQARTSAFGDSIKKLQIDPKTGTVISVE